MEAGVVAAAEWSDTVEVGTDSTVREASPRYGDGKHGEGEGSVHGLERFRLRGDEPFTDEEVERLENLAARIGERSGQLDAGEQELLEWIAEFDRLEGWKLHGHRNCVDWLVLWTGASRRTARERLRVARALENLPQTKDAMRHGRISFSKVRAIARLGELEAEDEATIVEFAEKTTAPEVEKLVRRRRELDRPSEAERERRRHARRKLAVVPDDQGMYVVRGRLDPEVGAILMRALEAASDALYRVERQEPLGPERPEPEQRRADALGLLCERALAAGFGVPGRGGGPVEPGEEGGAGSDDAPWPEAAAHPEGGPAEPEGGPAGPASGSAEPASGSAGPASGSAEPASGSAGPASGPAGPASGSAEPASGSAEPGESLCTCGGHPAPIMGTHAEHHQVFLYLDPDAFTSNGEPRHTHLEDGTRVSLETVRRLTCDTSVVPVLGDVDGSVAGNGSVADNDSVLNVGRRTRTIPPAIRRALWLRDGGCRFPGCGLRFTQGHHVDHWALGGETCVDNLVSLCRVHHRAVHEDGFVVKALGDGRFKFYSPEGWPLGDTPPRVLLEPGDPIVELILANRRRGVRPRWDQATASYATEGHIPDELLFRAWNVLDPA